MSLWQAKLEAERERLEANADIGPGHKEALGDMLLAAYHASNGAPDKMQALTEAVAAQAICLSRDAVHRREDIASVIASALKEHRDTCVLAAQLTPSGLAAKASAWLTALRPALWPLSVALGIASFSPHAKSILQAIVAIAKAGG